MALTVGPWGGEGGGAWDDGVHSGIRKLIIKHGSAIDSIQIEYDHGGISMPGFPHGGLGGETSVVTLNYPEEYLISMHGFYDRHSWSPVIITSITFETNKMTHGPFGEKNGNYFSIPTNGCKIVGFHGKSGDYLDAIGVHLKPI